MLNDCMTQRILKQMFLSQQVQIESFYDIDHPMYDNILYNPNFKMIEQACFS